MQSKTCNGPSKWYLTQTKIKSPRHGEVRDFPSVDLSMIKLISHERQKKRPRVRECAMKYSFEVRRIRRRSKLIDVGRAWDAWRKGLVEFCGPETCLGGH